MLTNATKLRYSQYMKRLLLIIPLTALIFLGVSCIPKHSASNGKLKVVTSFYPVGYIVDRVGGTYIDNSVIIGNGVEPHDYEPTINDAQKIADADVVVYNGLGVDNWIKDSVAQVESQARVLVLSQDNDAWVLHSSESGSAYDPHTWLSPAIVEAQVDRVRDVLIAQDSAHADAYRANAAQFIDELHTLEASFDVGIGPSAQCSMRTFVTAHAAFAYLAAQEHLTMEAITGISPEEEPSAATIASVVEVIRSLHVPIVFYETLSSPAIANTIAQETGTQARVLNPIEGLSEENIMRGDTYMTLMQHNLAALKEALECK